MEEDCNGLDKNDAIVSYSMALLEVWPFSRKCVTGGGFRDFKSPCQILALSLP